MSWAAASSRLLVVVIDGGLLSLEHTTLGKLILTSILNEAKPLTHIETTLLKGRSSTSYLKVARFCTIWHTWPCMLISWIAKCLHEQSVYLVERLGLKSLIVLKGESKTTGLTPRGREMQP